MASACSCGTARAKARDSSCTARRRRSFPAGRSRLFLPGLRRWSHRGHRYSTVTRPPESRLQAGDATEGLFQGLSRQVRGFRRARASRTRPSSTTQLVAPLCSHFAGCDLRPVFDCAVERLKLGEVACSTTDSVTPRSVIRLLPHHPPEPKASASPSPLPSSDWSLRTE